MSCNITSGITKSCNTGLGGVKTVWLGNGPVVTQWYEYEMDLGTANLTEVYDVNPAGGIVGFQQQLTIQLLKMSAAKQEQIKKIAEANDMRVRVEVNDGTKFEFGNERGAYLASGTTDSGLGYGDFNGSTLVIQSESKEPMNRALGDLIVHATDSRTSQLGISPDCGSRNNYIFASTVVQDTYGSWSQYGCGEINTFTAAMGLTYPFPIRWVVEVTIDIHTAMPNSLWQEFTSDWALNTSVPDLVPATVTGIPQTNPGVTTLNVTASVDYDVTGPGSYHGATGLIICNPYGPTCPDFTPYANQTSSDIKIYAV